MNNKKIVKRMAGFVMAAVMAVGCTPFSVPENMISGSFFNGKKPSLPINASMVASFADHNSPAKQMGELDDMLDFATEHNINTIFFNVNSPSGVFYKSDFFPYAAEVNRTGEDGENFDPLDYLTLAGWEKNIQVIAVVDLFALSGADGYAQTDDGYLLLDDSQVQEMILDNIYDLVDDYYITGVLIDNFEPFFTSEEDESYVMYDFIDQISSVVTELNKTAYVGLSLDMMNEYTIASMELASNLAVNNVVNLVAPEMYGELDDYSQYSYLGQIDILTEFDYGNAVFLSRNKYDVEDTTLMESQLLANTMFGNFQGAIFEDYLLLKETPDQMEERFGALMEVEEEMVVVDLSYPRTLGIQYPDGNTGVWDSAIFIMGTSDADQPLYLNGKEVERISTTGTYGVKVDLAVGSNTITVKQGNETDTVVVTRYSGSSTTSTISQITTGTIFPRAELGVNSNESIAISVTGPAGATITASLAGHSATLTQAAAADSGTPATFKGTINLSSSNFAANDVTDAGPIVYTVTYNDNTVTQKSPASVYVAGANIPLMVEGSIYVISLLENYSNDGSFTTSMKYGGRAEVINRYTTTTGNLVYQLSNKTYVHGVRVNIVKSADQYLDEIVDVVKTTGDDWEQYDFLGGQPAIIATQEGNQLNLEFLDVDISYDYSQMIDGMVTAVNKRDTDYGFVLELTLEPDVLWGYDITHSDEMSSVYLRHKPTLSDTYGRPLEGIYIMLDPGHGDYDSGALGVAGMFGPNEADLNLAVSYGVKYKLEQLGAKVTMTRYDDETPMGLDDRTFLSEEERPHIFLSLHHNSAVLTNDLNRAQRMEVYYYEDIAANMATLLMDNLSVELNRTATLPDPSYYYVTRQTFAPSALFEMAFTINPVEYEKSCNLSNIIRAGSAVGRAIIGTIEAVS